MQQNHLITQGQPFFKQYDLDRTSAQPMHEIRAEASLGCQRSDEFFFLIFSWRSFFLLSSFSSLTGQVEFGASWTYSEDLDRYGARAELYMPGEAASQGQEEEDIRSNFENLK